jgi:hypothetical protein
LRRAIQPLDQSRPRQLSHFPLHGTETTSGGSHDRPQMKPLVGMGKEQAQNSLAGLSE